VSRPDHGSPWSGRDKNARETLSATGSRLRLAHLTSARSDFRAQVPDWVGLDKNLVVVLSGLVEIALGLALIVVRRRRSLLGFAAGLFFTAVFPGNTSQFVDGDDAFGLNSDAERRNRLFFQPVLIAWAWWSTEALAIFRRADG